MKKLVKRNKTKINKGKLSKRWRKIDILETILQNSKRLKKIWREVKNFFKKELKESRKQTLKGSKKTLNKCEKSLKKVKETSNTKKKSLLQSRKNKIYQSILIFTQQMHILGKLIKFCMQLWNHFDKNHS